MSKTSTGLEKNIAAGLCYVFGWVSGLIFLLIEKEDQDIRFHAMQSIIVFAGLNILQMVLTISFIGIPLLAVIGVVGIVLWILLVIKAFQGERYKLPIVGDLAEKWASQVKI